MKYKNCIEHKSVSDLKTDKYGIVPIIEHKIEKVNVIQRAYDGYINAPPQNIAVCVRCHLGRIPDILLDYVTCTTVK